MSDEKVYNDWDMEISKWRGYVVRALEDITKEQEETNQRINIMNDKLDKMDSRLTGLQVKIAGIGGVSGLIVSIIMILLSKAVGA